MPKLGLLALGGLLGLSFLTACSDQHPGSQAGDSVEPIE